jgi:hypothetical protein
MTNALTRNGASPTRLGLKRAEVAVRVVPYISAPEFERTLAAWSRAEARAALLTTYPDEHGSLDPKGNPCPALDALPRWERLAADHRGRLGLDPAFRARLEREMADAARDRSTPTVRRLRGLAGGSSGYALR